MGSFVVRYRGIKVKGLNVNCAEDTDYDIDEDVKSFPGHAGRPGKVGGSAPANETGVSKSSSRSSSKRTSFQRSVQDALDYRDMNHVEYSGKPVYEKDGSVTLRTPRFMTKDPDRWKRDIAKKLGKGSNGLPYYSINVSFDDINTTWVASIVPTTSSEKSCECDQQLQHEGGGDGEMKQFSPEKEVVRNMLGISAKEYYGVGEKGGPGSGNHDHKGIPGHQGGSLPKGESGSGSSDSDSSEFKKGQTVNISDEGKITAADASRVPGWDKMPTKRGFSIQFDGVPGAYKIKSEADAHVNAKLAQIEKTLGTKLERDRRTDFPSFTIYKDGEEWGGG